MPWTCSAAWLNPGDVEAGLKHLQHGFDLHHFRLQPDALAACV
jgi:hypothetical protein